MTAPYDDHLCRLHFGGHLCTLVSLHPRTPHRCLCGVEHVGSHPFEREKNGVSCWCGNPERSAVHGTPA